MTAPDAPGDAVTVCAVRSRVIPPMPDDMRQEFIETTSPDDETLRRWAERWQQLAEEAWEKFVYWTHSVDGVEAVIAHRAAAPIAPEDASE